MDLDPLIAQLPLVSSPVIPFTHPLLTPWEFRLGRRLVTAKKAELFNTDWPTVCRFELDQPLLLRLIQPIGVLCPWIKTR